MSLTDNIANNRADSTYRTLFFVSLPFAFIGLCGLLALAFAIWESVVPGQKVSLPDDVETLSRFVETMPQPSKISIIDISGNTYIVVIGGVRRPLPSGDPVYIFDRHGRLISWTFDTGDAGEGHPYHKYFRRAENSRDVSIEEALQFVSVR